MNRVQPRDPQVSPRPAAAVRPTRTFRALAAVSARRVRGLSFLASLSLVVVVPPLAALSVLPWWGLGVAVAVLMANFAWLRHAAVAERAAGRVRVSAHRTRTAPGQTVRPAVSSARPTSQTPARPAVSAQPVVADRVAEAVTGVAEVPELVESAADADLTGWAPVPVPPPTYTLKAKAERPEPAPAAVTEPTPAQPSSFDGLVDDDELDGLLDRRASGA